MQPLHSILRKFVREHGFEGGVVLNALRNQWVNLVGDAVAAHTYPDTIKGNVLTLIVDTPQWMHHLSFYKEDITEKLSPFDVKEIRFRTGRIPEKPEESHNTEGIELSDEDSRYIDNTLKNIKDEELKEKFRKLIMHGLTIRKK